MENITIGQVATILAFLTALIGSIEYLCVRIKKWLKRALKDEIEPLKNLPFPLPPSLPPSLPFAVLNMELRARKF